MTTAELLAELNRRGVELFLDSERLRFRAPAGALSPALRTAVTQDRNEIIERLRSLARAATCALCDRWNWVDEPPKGGRIRTTCRVCGRFIGFRPEHVA